jgi:hypothetical protein
MAPEKLFHLLHVFLAEPEQAETQEPLAAEVPPHLVADAVTEDRPDADQYHQVAPI